MAGILRFEGSESRACNLDEESRDKSSGLESSSILKGSRFLVEALF
jgi:hypothetical protein